MTDRAAFEAWADARKGAPLRSRTDDSYDYPLGRLMFEAWQEAARQERQACADVVESEQTGDMRDRHRDSGLRLAAAAIRARSAASG